MFLGPGVLAGAGQMDIAISQQYSVGHVKGKTKKINQDKQRRVRQCNAGRTNAASIETGNYNLTCVERSWEGEGERGHRDERRGEDR